MDRIIVLYIPSLLGLMWDDQAGVSIVWSLAGSVFIAVISHTRWFRQSDERVPVTHRLLRPLSIYQAFFLGLHVMGGTFYALDAAGYSFWGQVASPQEGLLSLAALCQSYMLLGHASAIAGMKVVGFRYGRPKYLIPSVPPYGLIVISFLTLGSAAIAAMIPGLLFLSIKLLDLSFTAIVVETWLSVRRRRFTNAALTFILFGFNVFNQLLSGWKGLALWSILTLGALFYSLMPRRVVVGGIAFVLVWMLYLYPFGQALRQLTWEHGVETNLAASMSIDFALNMTFEERLDNIWLMMTTRANELWQFVQYVQHVPDRRPYYGLELLQESFLGLAPRVLWPEKPDLERVVMQRVYEAGVIIEGTSVSAKPSFYVDAYLSGGWLAILFGCILFGMVGMVVSRMCEQLFGGYEIGTCFIYTGLFAPWLNSGPNFLFFVGAIWSSLITMFGLFFLGLMMGWIVPARALWQSSKEDVAVIGQPAFYANTHRLQ